MSVHDHFEGSAHCVECGGPCRLTGVELALTEMIRWRLEPKGCRWLSVLEISTLLKIGVDPGALVKRVREVNGE